MKIHIPDRSRKWYCGPYAFAAITGDGFEEARAKINRVRGRRDNQGIRGLPTYTLLAALEADGYNPVCLEDWRGGPKGPTLGHWLDHHNKIRGEGEVYLVLITGHYVMVNDEFLTDNQIKRRVHVAYAPHRRCRVKAVWRITERKQRAA